MSHYTTWEKNMQAPQNAGAAGELSVFLDDRSATGRVRPWREKKIANELLAIAYDSVNPDKAARLRGCGSYLSFAVQPDGEKRLVGMGSCRVRLCPLCAWRRSLKVYANTMAILDYMDKHGEYAYIFLTLTMKNCASSDLSNALDSILSAWGRLRKREEFSQAVKGWYRGLEVTHNKNPLSQDYDTYHPHLHCLIAVNPSYFTGRTYLSQARWTQLWKDVLRVDYTPIVDVRRVKGNRAADVAEAAKYAAKEADYIIPDDWDLTLETVETLDAAFDHRRFVAYGLAMLEAKRALALDDEETGDLVNIDGEPEISADSRVVTYYWYTGYRQYCIGDMM